MSQSDPFRDVWLRVARAAEHLDHLRGEVESYTRSRPFVPVMQDEEALRQAALRWPDMDPAAKEELRMRHCIVVATDVCPLPDSLPVVVGEFLYNLRAALDYIAYALVRSKATNLPATWERRTQFPIKNAARQPARDPGTRLPATPLLTFATTVAIERELDRLQPYNVGDARATKLALVRDLNDHDKHRTLNVVVSHTGKGRVTLTFPNGRKISEAHRGTFQAVNGEWTQQRLGAGTPLGSLACDEVVSQLSEKLGPLGVDAEIERIVSLDEVGTHTNPAVPLVDVLGDLLAFLQDDVVPVFRSLV